MTKSELNSRESTDFALGGPLLRPKDSATLILLDRSGGKIKLLMGRRHAGHRFMPGRYVFPGGRTDPDDARVAASDALDPLELDKLTAGSPRTSAARARAIAMSAIRETYEEAGLLIGQKSAFATDKAGWKGFAEAGVTPSLSPLRLLARAITPPGRVRRFDTRFFAAWRSDVAHELPDGGPTDELEAQVWLTPVEARELDLPIITKRVMSDIEDRLRDDPELRPGGPVPFYRLLHNRMRRDVL